MRTRRNFFNFKCLFLLVLMNMGFTFFSYANPEYLQVYLENEPNITNTDYRVVVLPFSFHKYFDVPSGGVFGLKFNGQDVYNTGLNIHPLQTHDMYKCVSTEIPNVSVYNMKSDANGHPILNQTLGEYNELSVGYNAITKIDKSTNIIVLPLLTEKPDGLYTDDKLMNKVTSAVTAGTYIYFKCVSDTYIDKTGKTQKVYATAFYKQDGVFIKIETDILDKDDVYRFKAPSRSLGSTVKQDIYIFSYYEDEDNNMTYYSSNYAKFQISVKSCATLINAVESNDVIYINSSTPWSMKNIIDNKIKVSFYDPNNTNIAKHSFDIKNKNDVSDPIEYRCGSWRIKIEEYKSNNWYTSVDRTFEIVELTDLKWGDDEFNICKYDGKGKIYSGDKQNYGDVSVIYSYNVKLPNGGSGGNLGEFGDFLGITEGYEYYITKYYKINGLMCFPSEQKKFIAHNYSNYSVNIPYGAGIQGCEGKNSYGYVIVQAIDGLEPYQFSTEEDGEYSSSVGQNGITDAIPKTCSYMRSNVEVKNHTYYIKDKNGCIASNKTPTNISLGSKFSTTSVTSNDFAGCVNSETAKVYVTVAAGTANYTYTLSKGTENISKVSTSNSKYEFKIPKDKGAGDYKVKVTDANGCETSETTVSIKITPFTATATVTNINGCENNDNTAGSIKVSVTGGTTPYTYSSNGGGIQQTSLNEFKYKTQGDKTISVTDKNLCLATVTKTIALKNAFSASMSSSSNIVGCENNDNAAGSIKVSVSGGTTPYTYSSDGGGIQQQNSPNEFKYKTIGDKTITVTDKNLCPATVKKKIELDKEFKYAAKPVSITNFSGCTKANDASLTVSVKDGNTGNYTYYYGIGSATKQESSPSQSYTIKNLKDSGTGTYTVYVEDSKGCKTEKETDSVGVSNKVSISATPSPAICNGGNGKIVVIPSNFDSNVTTYFYKNSSETEYKNSQSGVEFVLPAGTYDIKASDGSCVSEQKNIVVGQPDKLSATYKIAVPIVCYGGEATVEAEPSSTDLILHYKGNDDKTADDNKTYQINVPSGTYKFFVTDKNKCESNAEEVEIKEPNKITINKPTIIAADCKQEDNGAIYVTAQGGNSGYIYKLSNSSGYPYLENSTGTFESLYPANYTLSVVDSKKCVSDIEKLEVESNELLELLDVQLTDVSCYDDNTGKIELSASFNKSGFGGKYKYTLLESGEDEETAHNTTGIFSNLYANDYKVTVQPEGSKCVKTEEVTIDQPAALSFTTDPTNCTTTSSSDGELEITPKGGTLDYTIVVKDNAGNVVSEENYKNLSPDAYTVSVSDANGCVAESQTVSINRPDKDLSLDVTELVNVDCFGANTGSITVKADGGWGNYKYSLSGPGQKIDENKKGEFQGLVAGDYTITVTDLLGVTKTITQSITQPEQLSVTSDVTDANCHGSSDGVVVFSISGGTSGYTLNLDGKKYENDKDGKVAVDGLSAKTYSYKVDDANGCSLSKSFTVGQPSELSVRADVNSYNNYNIKCFGGTDMLKVVASGGVTPYSFSLDGGSALPVAGEEHVFNNLPEGNYQVVCIDAHGCRDTMTQELVQPDKLVISSIDTVRPSCNGYDDGKLTVNVEGGIFAQDYSFYFDKAKDHTTSNVYSGLKAGNHQVMVSDANGCMVDTAIVLGQPDVFKAEISGVVNVSCYGDSTGEISFDINGGSMPYYYSLDGSSSLQFEDFAYSVSGLLSKSDKYLFRLTDKNGCQVNLSQVITQPEQITAETALKDYNGYNVQCNGFTSDAEVSIKGGAGEYVVEFGGLEYNGSKVKFGELAAGEYSYLVTDGSGCQRNFLFELKQPEPFTVSVTPINIKCYGQSDGALDIVFSGGVANYLYDISDASQNIISSGISSGQYLQKDMQAGYYRIKALDMNNCEFKSSGTVSQPKPIEVSLLKKDITCKGSDDGAISASVSGGTQPYRYMWSNNGGESSSSIYDLPEGVYKLQVVDVFGCKAIDTDSYPESSIEILEPSFDLAFSYFDVTNPSCSYRSDGEISCKVEGGWGKYSYSLDDMNFKGSHITSLPAGQHKVSVSDSNNCTITRDVTLTSPAALSFVEFFDTITCYGGTTQVNIGSASGGTGDYRFSLDGGNWQSEPMFGNVSAGRHTIVMRDESMCELYKELTIAENERIVITDELIDMSGGAEKNTISVMVSGGVAPYSYQWKDTNATVSKLEDIGSGIYSVTVTDVLGCSRKVSYFINDVSSPVPVVTDVVCPGGSDGSIAFDDSIGSSMIELYNGTDNSYIASSTDLAFTKLSKGIYKMKLIYDDHNEYVYAEISAPDTLGLTFQKIDNLCNGGNSGSAELRIVGGVEPYDIVWQNASGKNIASGLKVTDLSAGKYIAKVADGSGCSSGETSVAVNITQPDNKFTIKSLNVNDASCYRSVDGSAWMTASGNYGNVIYTLDGDELSGDYAYNLKAGAHNVYAVDQNNCKASATVWVGEPQMIDGDIEYVDIIRCNGMAGSVMLKNVRGGTSDTYMYKLANDSKFSLSPVFSNLYAGEQSFIVKDANGCSNYLHFTIEQPEPITIDINDVKDESCGKGDGQISVNITSGNALQSVIWDDPKNQSGSVASNLSSGSYRITVTDVNNCTADANYTVKNLSAPFLSVYDIKDVKCHGYSDGVAKLVLGGGTGSVIVDWCGSDSTAYTSSSKLKAGSHTVIATDSLGCADTVNFTIKQPDPVAYSIVANNPLCYNDSTGSASIQIPNDYSRYTYLWSTGATGSKVANLPAGDYSVAVTSPDGCVFNAGLSLSNPEKIVITDISSVSAKCSAPNGQITVKALGGVGNLMFSVDSSTTETDGTISEVTGGEHLVRVRDNNYCALDTLYNVGNIEAPVLSISSLSNVKCNGESNGSIAVKVDKGTAPFSYNWNSGKSTTQSSISGLAQGSYSVRAVDAYGCSDTLAFDISEPLKLTAYELSSQMPTCHDYSDGSIKVGVIGGTMPYAYLWGNGQTSDNAVKLLAGSHYVDVTDKNGCTDRKYFELGNPNPVAVDLPDVLNICSNQTADLNAGNAGSFFLWSGPENFESVAQSISVKKAGTYNVTVTTPVGCVGTGSTLVNVSEKEINANFLLQSDAYVGDTIVMIEISWPLPESIEWACPDGVNIIEDGGDEIMFVADEVGSYNIGLTTYNDICTEQTFKSITVNPKDQKPLAEVHDKGKIIKSANVYPVPATGPFNLDIELNEDHDVNIEIVHVSGKIHTVRHMKGDRHYILNFSNADMNAGIHTINITSGNESVTKKLVIVK